MTPEPGTPLAKTFSTYFGKAQWESLTRDMEGRLKELFPDLWGQSHFDLVSGLAETLYGIAHDWELEGIDESWFEALNILALAERAQDERWALSPFGAILVKDIRDIPHLEGTLLVWLRTLGVEVPGWEEESQRVDAMRNPSTSPPAASHEKPRSMARPPDIEPLADGILPRLDPAEFDEQIVEGFEAMRAGRLGMVPDLNPEVFDEQIVTGFAAIRAQRPEDIPLLSLDEYDMALAHGFATMKTILAGHLKKVRQSPEGFRPVIEGERLQRQAESIRSNEPDELELGEALAVEVALVGRMREADGLSIRAVVNEFATHVQGVCGAWGVKLDARQSREVEIAAQALYVDQGFMDEVAEWKRLNGNGVVPRSLFRTKLLAAVKRSVDGFPGRAKR